MQIEPSCSQQHSYGRSIGFLISLASLALVVIFLPICMGSWVRTITTPFRKACTILGPQRDGKKPQQQSSAMVRHVDAERAKLHGEVMACAYEDVQVMWSMLDRPGTDPGAQRQLVTGADRLFMHPTNGYDDKE